MTNTEMMKPVSSLPCFVLGHYVPMSTYRPPDYDLVDDFTTQDDLAILIYPEEISTPSTHKFVPPTLLPLPVPPDGNGNSDLVPLDTFESAFDEKWNMEDPNTVTEPPDPPPVHTKTLPGTMVLVIGIILGAFVAMILIVIIVLKMRTRVDGVTKCEEPSSALPRYQFATPNDYGEVDQTATTSLMEAGQMVAGPMGGSMTNNHNTSQQAQPPQPPGMAAANNGFFNNNCALNGDRSRLFRKSNGSKPVREWYV